MKLVRKYNRKTRYIIGLTVVIILGFAVVLFQLLIGLLNPLKMLGTLSIIKFTYKMISNSLFYVVSTLITRFWEFSAVPIVFFFAETHTFGKKGFLGKYF